MFTHFRFYKNYLFLSFGEELFDIAINKQALSDAQLEELTAFLRARLIEK